MKPVRVGVIGCGNISRIYFEAMQRFRILEVTACADIVKERAQATAQEWNLRALSVKQLISDANVDLVLNLTVPASHHEVAMAALQAGKHVYNEKPLALRREDGHAILQQAVQHGLLVGCAPDTVLGAGIQTCRKLIDDGWIGPVVSATAFMQCHGHENWHPDPEFYYQPGGGPLFDMGPYYLSALVQLVGPLRRVAASTRSTFPTRTIGSEAKRGQEIRVDVPTHLAGICDFQNGAVGTIITSFDVWAHSLPCIEIHGATGSLSVPDPNTFGGAIRLHRAGAAGWTEVPYSHGFSEQSRGLGVADMAAAIRHSRPHRANGEIGYHVLDAMHAFHESSEKGRHVRLRSRCRRPAPMPMDPGADFALR